MIFNLPGSRAGQVRCRQKLDSGSLQDGFYLNVSSEPSSFICCPNFVLMSFIVTNPPSIAMTGLFGDQVLARRFDM